MFSVCSSDVHYIQRSRTGLHFLGENIIRNINVNYFELEPVIQGNMCFKEKILKARQITKTYDGRQALFKDEDPSQKLTQKQFMLR